VKGQKRVCIVVAVAGVFAVRDTFAAPPCGHTGYHFPEKTPREIVELRQELDEEISRQETMLEIAAARRGPQESWQVRLLRTLPPDRTVDMVYGKGLSWDEELKRRRRERAANLVSFLEDKPRVLMLLDGPRPPEVLTYAVVPLFCCCCFVGVTRIASCRPAQADASHKEPFTMRTIRRFGQHASRCFVSMKYVELEKSLPETTADVDTSSLYPYDEGSVTDRAIIASKRLAAAYGLPVPKEVR
jgi:hypothetical protein